MNNNNTKEYPVANNDRELLKFEGRYDPARIPQPGDDRFAADRPGIVSQEIRSALGDVQNQIGSVVLSQMTNREDYCWAPQEQPSPHIVNGRPLALAWIKIIPRGQAEPVKQNLYMVFLGASDQTTRLWALIPRNPNNQFLIFGAPNNRAKLECLSSWAGLAENWDQKLDNLGCQPGKVKVTCPDGSTTTLAAWNRTEASWAGIVPIVPSTASFAFYGSRSYSRIIPGHKTQKKDSANRRKISSDLEVRSTPYQKRTRRRRSLQTIVIDKNLSGDGPKSLQVEPIITEAGTQEDIANLTPPVLDFGDNIIPNDSVDGPIIAGAGTQDIAAQPLDDSLFADFDLTFPLTQDILPLMPGWEVNQ